MVDTFDAAVTGDYIQATDLNQIFDAWQAVADKGVPLRLTQVDSATYYAGDFRNKHANGYHFRVMNSSDETLFSIVGNPPNSVVTFGKDITMGAGLYVDGVDIGAHVHSGDAGDAPQLTAGSYGAGTIPAAAFATGAIAAALPQAALDASVPILKNRQGGSPTSWSITGTTDYAPTDVRMQVGVRTVSIAASNAGAAAVTFDDTFDNFPMLIISPLQAATTTVYNWGYSSLLTTGFTINVITSTTVTETFTFAWMAIGDIA